MKKVVIFGSNGLLGQNLVDQFYRSYQVVAASRSVKNHSAKKDIDYYQLDMINRSEVNDFLSTHRPDIIINAAAYTDVDGSETEKELCWNTNVRAVENIIDIAETFKTILVHISSDYVFDGEDGHYRETDTTNPLGNYARSKMAAENIISSSNLEYIIARTQVLYGYSNQSKLNFATWVISRLSNNQQIRVVMDQVGNPTLAEDLSESIFRLLEREEYGLFHIAGCEEITRYDFAAKIADVFNLDGSMIERILTSDLNQAAPRPKNSTFNIDKLVNRIDWEPSDVTTGLQRLKTKLNEQNG